jgi:fission process protein 1
MSTATSEKTASAAADEEVDIYRDTPVRLLGYSNEVGEAFRALVHVNWVRASYGLASAYVLADTFDKASKANGGGKDKAIAAFDTIVWQALASVMIPGFTINRVCAGSLHAMERFIPHVALNARKWMTTGLGLGIIPFFVHPIDSGVHYAMDNTTR